MFNWQSCNRSLKRSLVFSDVIKTEILLKYSSACAIRTYSSRAKKLYRATLNVYLPSILVLLFAFNFMHFIRNLNYIIPVLNDAYTMSTVFVFHFLSAVFLPDSIYIVLSSFGKSNYKSQTLTWKIHESGKRMHVADI